MKKARKNSYEEYETANHWGCTHTHTHTHTYSVLNQREEGGFRC